MYLRAVEEEKKNINARNKGKNEFSYELNFFNITISVKSGDLKMFHLNRVSNFSDIARSTFYVHNWRLNRFL